MGYPGDQQQPGGWASSRPPHSPYGPGDEEQPAQGGSSFESPYGSGPSYGPSPSFGAASPESAESDPYGTDPYGTDPYGTGAFGSDPYASAPGGGPEGYGPGPGFGPDSAADHGDGPGGFEPGDGPDRPSGGSKKPWVIGGAVAAGVLVLGGGAGLAFAGGGDKPKPKSTPSTNSNAAPPTVNPTPSPTETGRGTRTTSRATDPKPLTLNEVFKRRTFTTGGKKYTMTNRTADRKCAQGVHGAAFVKSLTKAKCNQVLRATFSDGTLIGTIGIVNLKSAPASIAVQKVSRAKDAYVKPLPGSGSTKKIGQGFSAASADTNGHYLIMSWVQYPNGKRVAKSAFPAVTKFVQNVTFGSNLRPALNYRSMEGKPA